MAQRRKGVSTMKFSELKIKQGRRPFTGREPERRTLRRARRTMLRVFNNQGLWKLAERLHGLIGAQVDWRAKRERFDRILEKYAGAVTSK